MKRILQWFLCIAGRHDFKRARKGQDKAYTHCTGCDSKRIKRKRKSLDSKTGTDAK